jgi:hypothetical protein
MMDSIDKCDERRGKVFVGEDGKLKSWRSRNEKSA